MEKIKCMICEKKISENNTYITNHLRRKHDMKLEDYLNKYFEDIGEYSNKEKCSFCNNNSRYKIIVDYNERTYYFDYTKGFFCNTNECKKMISLKFLSEEYEPFKFSKIGSKSEYLSELHKITIEKAKELKYNRPLPDKQFICNLNGFIKKFGEEEGKKKYFNRLKKVIKNLDPYAGLNNLESFIGKYGKEEGKKKYQIRIDKIKKSNTKKWYIDKYGEALGEEKWNSYMDKLRNHINSKDTSKRITDFLDKNNIEFEKEVRIDFEDGGYYFIDYYLPNFNLYIEYFGDYWHCNPSIYESNYYHQYINQSANEIWKKDETRLNKIFKNINKSIIVIWESSDIDEQYLLKILINSMDKKMIIKL